MNATPPTWSLVDDRIVDTTSDADTGICHLELENGHWQDNARLICAAPALLVALRQSVVALEEAGKVIPRDSRADMLASGALGMAYRLIRQVEAGDDTIRNEGA